MDEAKEQPLQELNFTAFINSDDLRKKLNLPADNRLDTAAMDVNLTLRALKGKDANWPDLRGLRILDLGCGSEISPKSRGTDNWAPYFCRICAGNGAEVVGVDLTPASEADSKKYTHIEGDVVELVREGSLGGLVGKGFDIIHSRFLTNSPDFMARLAKYRITEEEFLEALKKQVLDLLKNGGILTIDYLEISGETYYRKMNGALEKAETK